MLAGLFFPPVTHSPSYQVEIASMQTVSRNTETSGDMDIQTDRKKKGLHNTTNNWKKTKDHGITTVVNALSNASVLTFSKVRLFADDKVICLTKFSALGYSSFAPANFNNLHLNLKQLLTYYTVPTGSCGVFVMIMVVKNLFAKKYATCTFSTKLQIARPS